MQTGSNCSSNRKLVPLSKEGFFPLLSKNLPVFRRLCLPTLLPPFPTPSPASLSTPYLLMPQLLGNVNVSLQAAPAPPVQTPASLISLGHSCRPSHFLLALSAHLPRGIRRYPATLPLPKAASEAEGESLSHTATPNAVLHPQGHFKNKPSALSEITKTSIPWCSCAPQSLLLIFRVDKIRIKLGLLRAQQNGQHEKVHASSIEKSFTLSDDTSSTHYRYSTVKEGTEFFFETGPGTNPPSFPTLTAI